MSSRIFQGVIVQMKDATERCIGVVDEQGFVIACSELSMIGSRLDDFQAAVGEVQEPLFTTSERTYKILSGSTARFEDAVFVEGSDQAARSICILAAVGMTEASTNFEEKHNKAAFVKNIISDNILPGDIYLKARELHFNSEVSRVVMLIKITSKAEISAYDVLQNLFPDKSKDFIININETEIALVKELKPGIEEKDLEKLAGSIVDTLSSEFYTHCTVGIGTIVVGIKDLAHSFKEAQVALEVGKVFDNERTIISYDNLGIARLVYQLPTTLCEMFLKEVFKRGSIESLDQETLFTIQKFFENNLNVSETSRKLFVHRNTLVYRLEKIKKLTGLDLREFEDAIVFKVALMVKRYLTASPTKY